ncbi:MAG: TolC family protein [bacterium]|nr:TolC family protein [bacterium]
MSWQRMLPLVLALGGLTWPTGCARFHDRPLSAAGKLDNFEARTLDRADLKEYLQAHIGAAQWPLQTWSLTDLTLAAFFYHPSLDVARAQLKTAKGEVITAGERPNPSVSFAPGFNSSNRESVSGVSSWIVDTALDIPIETAGKRGYRIAQAEHLSDAARLNITAAAWQVRSHVRQALLDLYAARETETLLLQQQAIQADNVRLLQLQQEAGEVSPFEVSQARIPLDATRLEVVEAQKKQAQARAQLASAVGVPLKALDGVRFSFDALIQMPSSPPAADVRRAALLDRADVRAALAEYGASQSALQLEITKQYPDVNLGPGYSYDQSENKWSLGVSLTLPVLNQNQGAIATAKGRRAEAAAKFSALQADIIGQIEQSVTNYEASLKKLQTARSLSEELKKRAEATRKMFQAGEILKLEVAAADLEVSTNALAQLTARVDALQALGQIEDALQQPADLPRWQGLIPQQSTDTKREIHHE